MNYKEPAGAERLKSRLNLSYLKQALYLLRSRVIIQSLYFHFFADSCSYSNDLHEPK
jgi:hypothetical protein